MRTFTYTAEVVGDNVPDYTVEIKIRAQDSRAASILASHFGMSKGLLLIGPRELDHQRVYY